MSKTKESFVFYKDWWNAISGMPKEIRSEVCESVIRYAFGESEACPDGMAAMALRFIAPQIDRDRVKYEAKCEKNRENGASGGRARLKEEPTNAAERLQTVADASPQKQSEASRSECRQSEANACNPDRTGSDNDNETENANDNKNGNGNANGCACENADKTPRTPARTTTLEEKIFNQFKSWLTAYAPTVTYFTEPLQCDEFIWLYRRYGAEKLKQCAADIHNKEAYLRNRKALTVFKSWIKNVKI